MRLHVHVGQRAVEPSSTRARAYRGGFRAGHASRATDAASDEVPGCACRHGLLCVWFGIGYVEYVIDTRLVNGHHPGSLGRFVRMTIGPMSEARSSVSAWLVASTMSS